MNGQSDGKDIDENVDSADGDDGCWRTDAMAAPDCSVPRVCNGLACCQVEDFSGHKPGNAYRGEDIAAASYCLGREDAKIEYDGGEPDASQPNAVQDGLDKGELQATM
jgi:hypothetical protein